MQANMVTFFILKSNHFGYNWCTWAGKLRISLSKFFFMSSCSFWCVLISDVRRFFHFLISSWSSVMFFLSRAYSKFSCRNIGSYFASPKSTEKSVSPQFGHRQFLEDHKADMKYLFCAFRCLSNSLQMHSGRLWRMKTLKTAHH